MRTGTRRSGRSQACPGCCVTTCPLAWLAAEKGRGQQWAHLCPGSSDNSLAMGAPCHPVFYTYIVPTGPVPVNLSSQGEELEQADSYRSDSQLLSPEHLHPPICRQGKKGWQI
ncbi:hypothetical protein Bbelb_045590 [Branchiostoma belcheri]|nr:hypothetical protein Bbelb_045590 [Branchiostoma belcheri]